MHDICRKISCNFQDAWECCYLWPWSRDLDCRHTISSKRLPEHGRPAVLRLSNKVFHKDLARQLRCSGLASQKAPCMLDVVVCVLSLVLQDKQLPLTSPPGSHRPRKAALPLPCRVPSALGGQIRDWACVVCIRALAQKSVSRYLISVLAMSKMQNDSR